MKGIQIRTLPVFPGNAPRRMNVALQVLRLEPAVALLREIEPSQFSVPKTGIILTKNLGILSGDCISSKEYLENILVPSALVNKIDLNLPGSRAITYTLSRSGERYALPLTDFTLRYSADNDFWLGDVLGRRTCGWGIKACGRRYEILKALYGSEKPLSKLMLSLAGHSDSGTVSGDIADLISLGLVNSESIDINSFGYNSLEWGGKTENLPGSENRHARAVADFLKRSGRVSLNEVANGTNIPPSQVVSAIGKLGEDRLVRFFDKFPITKKYEITMTDKGKQHWEGYFVPLYEFLSDRATLPKFEEQNREESYVRRALDVFIDRTQN